MKSSDAVTVHVSKKSILYAIGAVLSIFLLQRIQDFLMLLFLAIVFSSALYPLVRKIQKKGASLGVALVVVYLCFVSLIILFFSLIIPPLVGQTIALISRLDLTQYSQSFNLQTIQDSLKNLSSFSVGISQLGGSFSSIMSIITGTFSGVFTIFTFFVITFYLMADRTQIPLYLSWMLGGGKKAKQKMQSLMDTLEIQLGGWVRAELTLMSVIGILTYLGLLLLGVPYALPLAILAGILEAVPNIGPTIAAIPAIALAFIYLSPLMTFVVFVFYIIIQQLENNIIVPKVMSDAAEVSPLIAIIVLIVGAKLAGVGGAVLGIPLFIFFRAIVREFWTK
ncbi:MAG: hypothetical protein A2378_00880 [Candidatus Pacebacteria bacterium RIFOXYB1_FULL_44_10]|nr:MAG: hypothetical protein A2378_00880 [Candidatus Pacebacteria bacterium RIFOXYB1_FULL_44_10]